MSNDNVVTFKPKPKCVPAGWIEPVMDPETGDLGVELYNDRGDHLATFTCVISAATSHAGPRWSTGDLLDALWRAWAACGCSQAAS